MAEEIIFKVGVDTGNSAEDLSKVEAGINGMSKSSKDTAEEFSHLRSEIAKAAKEVDTMSKKFGEGSEQADEARKALGQLNMQYDSMSKSAVDLGAKFENVYGEMQPLSSRMGEMEDRLYELALAGKTNTDEFKELQAEVVRYKKVLVETDKAVDGLSERGKALGTALELGSTIVAGYGLVEGSMALMGGESEDLEKSMQNLIAITTVLNSVEQIRLAIGKQSSLMIGLTKIQTLAMAGAQWMYTLAIGSTTVAMQSLGVAIKNIPIVGWILAIVAALISLAAYLYSMADAEDNSKEVSEQLTKAYDKQKEAIDRVSKARLKGIDNIIRQRMEEGASLEEIGKLEIARLKESEAARKANVKNELKAIDDKNVNYRKALKYGNYELARSIRTEVNEHRAKYKELVGLEGQFGTDLKYQKTKTANDIKEREAKDTQEAVDKQKAANEKSQAARVKADEKKAEYAKTMQDLVIANIKNENERAIAAMGLANERELAELQKKYGKETDLEKQLKLKQAAELFKLMEAQDKTDNDALDAKTKEANEKKVLADKKLSDNLFKSKKAELEGRLIQIEDDFAAETELKKELALLELEEAKKNKEITSGELFKIEAEYKAKIDKLNEDQAAKEKTMRLDSINDSIAWAEKSVNAIQQLSDMAFANKMRKVEKGSKEEEKLARKQFKMNKALQLAGAIMDAGKAMTASLAMSPIAIGPVPNPAGIASLAFAGVTSLANIAKIAATQFESTTPPPTDAPPTVPAPNEQNVAGFQPMNGTLTSGLQGSGNTKVYVLDSDITAQQNNSQKVESLATMGG
jgi:predicted  nucleic acid-binding Zn-ribbon protein